MAIFNLGSINADKMYRLDHMPAAGETLAAKLYTTGLGGKGANQSVAASKAGSQVFHVGCIGKDALWTIDTLQSYGVDTSLIDIEETAPTGHATILVTPDGENRIVIFAGTNGVINADRVTECLTKANPGDTLMLQNETNAVAEVAQSAKALGLRVVYSAAPFEINAVKDVLPHVDLLALNEVEAAQLTTEMGIELTDIPVPELLVTRGSKGAVWTDMKTGRTVPVSAPKVDVVDTTGAGDTFIGFFCSGHDLGFPVEASLAVASAAAALQVTQVGTAAAIPDVLEVKTFLHSPAD